MSSLSPNNVQTLPETFFNATTEYCFCVLRVSLVLITTPVPVAKVTWPAPACSSITSQSVGQATTDVGGTVTVTAVAAVVLM